MGVPILQNVVTKLSMILVMDMYEIPVKGVTIGLDDGLLPLWHLAII